MKLAVIFPVVAPPFAAKSAAKPFVKVDNREIFLRTVELYAPRERIEQRIVVVPPDDLGTIQQKFAAHLGFQGVSVAGGGADWFSCVARALEKLNPEVEAVIIHDACCPAVPFTLLDALEEAFEKAKGVAGIVPVMPTRCGFADMGGGKAVEEYIDMSSVSEVQSPQIFSRKALDAAYAKRDKEASYVDDAEMILAQGGKILTIAGSRFNQRIDSDDALKLAKDLIDRMPKPKPKTPLTPFDEAQW